MSLHCNNSKTFIENSNEMVDIYENIEDYNPNNELKILIAFDDIIADMRSNKKSLNNYHTLLFYCTKNY